jgi:hypothetical protein
MTFIDFRDFNGLTPVQFQYVPDSSDGFRDCDYDDEGNRIDREIDHDYYCDAICVKFAELPTWQEFYGLPRQFSARLVCDLIVIGAIPLKDCYSNYLYYIEQVRGLKTKFKSDEKFQEFLMIAERENQ